MRLDVLGLPLEAAQALLEKEGIAPVITVTSAPRRAEETRGTLRVIHASDDGRRLTVARFLDPIADAQAEGGRNLDEAGV